MRVSRPPSPMTCFVLAAVVVVAAIGGLVLGSGGASRSPAGKGSGAATVGAGADGGVVIVGATAAGLQAAATRPPATAAGRVQENAELADPGLRRAHDRLLSVRPLFQHLPYRDRAIGVGIDRVLPGGALELLVTYLGSRSRAVADMRRLLARYEDPGTAYVERYRRVF